MRRFDKEHRTSTIDTESSVWMARAKRGSRDWLEVGKGLGRGENEDIYNSVNNENKEKNDQFCFKSVNSLICLSRMDTKYLVMLQSKTHAFSSTGLQSE